MYFAPPRNGISKRSNDPAMSDTSEEIHIKSEALIIRPYQKGDERAFLDFLDRNRERLRPVLAEWITEIHDAEGAAAFIKKMRAGQMLKNLFALGIFDRNAKMVGEVLFFNARWAEKKIEMGFYIDAGYENRGLMTVVNKACLGWAQMKWTGVKIDAKCTLGNAASQRVLCKCGFRPIARDEQFHYFEFGEMQS